MEVVKHTALFQMVVGFRGPSDNYRKIQGWEKDPVFLKYMQHPIFRDLTQKLIGDQVSIYRAMFMNKPPQNGAHLPYHQDGGSGWGLSSYRANQFVTVWTAIDDAHIFKWLCPSDSRQP